MLGSEIDALTDLPAEQQKRLARFASEVHDINLAGLGYQRVISLPSSEESRAVKKKCLLLLNKSVEPEVVKLMEAKLFKDLGVPPEEFENWSLNLMTSMDVTQADQLAAAVLKISEFAKVWNVATEISQHRDSLKSRLLLRAISRSPGSESMESILVALEGDDFRDFVVTESLSWALAESLKSEFLDRKSELMQQDTKLSSSEAELGAMKLLVDRLGKQFGDRQLCVFIPEFSNVCNQIKQEDSKAVSEWLHSDTSDKYPEIKKTLQLAFDCSRNTLRQSIDSNKRGDVRSRPEHAPNYVLQILNYIVDETISLRARSRVAMYLVSNDELSGDGVASCSYVIAEAYDAGQIFDARSNEAVFSALMTAGDTDLVKEAKVAFAKSLAGSLKVLERDNWWLLNVSHCMKLLALNEERNEALDLLDSGLAIGNEPIIAVTLIELGFYAEARQQCESIWSTNGFFPRSDDPSTFTKELESELPDFLDRYNDRDRTKPAEFLKRFNNHESRYLAELYFAGLKNSDSDDGVQSTRQSRLTALANRFSNIKFEVERNRQLALILVSNSYSKSNELDAALTNEIKGLSVDTLFENPDSAFRAKLLGAYLSMQIQLENFDLVESKWKEINRRFDINYSSDNIPWPAKIAAEELATTTFLSICKLLHDRTPGQMVDLLPVLRNLNQASYPITLSPKTTELAHLMAGRPDELAKYWKEQDADVQANSDASATNSDASATNSDAVARVSSVNELIARLAINFKRIEPTDPVARSNFVVSAWQFGQSHELSFGSDTLKTGMLEPDGVGPKFGIEQFAQLGILTNKEILEVGPKLAKINSINGEIWLQLARRQAKAGENSEAAESYRKSIDDATEDMENAKFNRRVEYANALAKLKRNEEAKRLLEGIPVEQLFDANKTIFKTLEKTLK